MRIAIKSMDLDFIDPPDLAIPEHLLPPIQDDFIAIATKEEVQSSPAARHALELPHTPNVFGPNRSSLSERRTPLAPRSTPTVHGRMQQ